jgi:hypothetical protein
MISYNAIFAGTARNVEKYIQKNLDSIDKCGAKFKSYIVIIYENDSEDNTRNILIKNFKHNYYYIFEDNITNPIRTTRIANGRNLILDKVRTINSMSNNMYDYLIMLDLDDVNESGTFINSIEECFKIDVEKWDGLMGNQSDKYYDIWALRCKGVMEYDCWEVYANGDDKVKEDVTNTMNNINFQRLSEGLGYLHPSGLSISSIPDAEPLDLPKVVGACERLPVNNNLIEVDSAFGGIAIYKIKSIPNNCYYKGTYIKNNNIYAKCEHVDFNETLKKNGGRLFILPTFLTS